jgi:hypothetical protein
VTRVDLGATGTQILVWIAVPGTHVPTNPNLVLPFAFSFLGSALTDLPIDWDSGVRFSDEREHQSVHDWRNRANGKPWTVVVDRVDDELHVREWWNNRVVSIDGNVMTVVEM